MPTSYRLTAVAAAVSGIILLSYAGGLFQGFEQILEDRLFGGKTIRSEIVIVAIDDYSIAKLGQWPWPRSYFAQFIERLEHHNPAAVGFDVMFSEPSRLGESDDAQLEAAIKRASYPIVFPIETSAQGALKPLERFSSHTQLGHINVTVDPDGVVRTFPFESGGEEPLSYQTLQEADIALPQSVLSERNRIVYAGAPGSFRTIPFSRILEDDVAESLEGKVILLGATAQDLHDNKPTPVSGGEPMAGVEIHANIANMLASGYRIVELPMLYGVLWILLAVAIPLLSVLYVRSFRKLFLINAAVGFLYLLAQITLFEAGIATPIIFIHLSWILSFVSLISYQYFVTDREKAEMRKLFGKYVSPKVLDEILKNPGAVVLGGEERTITVLFSDIRGFTTLSEKSTPTQLVEIINRYFSAMTQEILDNDGVVDKYIGDAIMAFWGAPLLDDKQADKAIKAALGMRARLEEFNKTLKAELGIEIAIGVGLYSGPAVVGNMGSLQRFDYTAMGDTVNISSRLEGITKTYGVSCIIGETTRAQLTDPQAYVIRELDQILVKGKKEPKRIYEPREKASFTEAMQKQLAAFERGRDAYYRGDWNAAIEELSEALTYGEDGPSTTLLARTKDLKKNPPERWEGVYAFKTK